MKQAALVGADAGVVVVGVEIGEVGVHCQRAGGRLPREALGEHEAVVGVSGKLQAGGIDEGAQFQLAGRGVVVLE